MRKSLIMLVGVFLVSAVFQPVQAASAVENGPNVLVLYDGPDIASNPGRLDALYLINLLGHFTIRRKVHSLDTYLRGEWQNYDAVFSIVYQRKYRVPGAFLEDIAQDPKTFCWLGNQVGQLDRVGLLRRHGLAFEMFTDQIKVNRVIYKNHTIGKGDPETNFLKVIDSDSVHVWATALADHHDPIPYAMQNENFWVFADSPFSYSSENDRYLVLADLLHDILGVQHAEDHKAILRIEDINAMSIPADLQKTLHVIRQHHIPFSFGFVPMYVNPQERLEFRMADKPDVVSMLHDYVDAGGAPVLHGYTHQYRGVTTDDYEFWDDLTDRPVRGDSEEFATRRIREAIKESMGIGVYPVTWETPHYAASPIDYKVVHRFFKTVFERRLAGPSLDTDQLFPYPVVDEYGQYVIPEDLAYIPIDDQRVEPILDAASAVSVVRDGYAGFFFHPFLKPQLLDTLISGIQKRGYHFIDIRRFPNVVNSSGRVITTTSGSVDIAGQGHYLNEYVYGPHGREISEHSVEVNAHSLVTRQVSLSDDETYVALRQDVPAPGLFKKILLLAKGDISIWQRKLETVISQESTRNPTKTIILWNADAKGKEKIDQESFLSAFTSLGFDVDKIDYARLPDGDLGPFTMLVIPSATARVLSPQLVDHLHEALNGGITLITDGPSPLSQELGIELGEASPVSILQDHLFVNQETRWPDRPSVPWITSPKPEDVSVFYSDRDTQHPLVISGRQHEGRYVYFAPLFDDITGEGYGRFPNLPQILMNELAITPIAARMGADVYFDPGYRQNISIEVLAKMWRRFGIRAVHVAAWHFYDRYSYDYARLVKVAHQNGILVYAWFEWPEVSEHFWEHHPAWREKTAALTDAHVDWRYLMNLMDPECMKAVLSDLDGFLRGQDWDGVDIGELTFESLEGPSQPTTFTPFNTQARREFKSLHQFDPVDLFDESSPHYWETNPADIQTFYQFRRDVNNRLMRTFLDHLRKQEIKNHVHWDIIVTMLDALQHPDLSNFLGIDVNRTVSLVNEFDATLQAEDPADDWSKAPDRYLKLGERYKALDLKNPFMIDINVLPVHSVTQRGFATAQPTGVELAQLWRAASSQASRVCFYAESTIYEHDWEIMPFAMASQAQIQREGDNWIVNAPSTIRLDVGRDTRGYQLDGQPWFCGEKGSVWIPEGEHILNFTRTQHPLFDASQLETHLVSISGELLGSQRVRRGLDVEYESSERCAMIFNKLPYKTYIDDEPAHLPTVRGDEGYTVLAPPGKHRLRILTETVGLYAVEFTSLVSASLIVLFGMASSGLLGILFIVVVARRRIRLWKSPAKQTDELFSPL